MNAKNHQRMLARLSFCLLALAAVALPSPVAAESPTECATFPDPDGTTIAGILIIDQKVLEQRIGAAIILDMVKDAGVLPPNVPRTVGTSVDLSQCVVMVQCLLEDDGECRR